MNELITLEINSKNKQELIDLLNTSKLVVEIMNEHNTFSVVRPDETDPPTETVHYVDIARVVNSKSERSEEHTSELQSQAYLVCRLLLEKKKEREKKKKKNTL